LQRGPQLGPELPAALNDPALRLDAIRAVAGVDDEALGELLMARDGTFTAAEKAEAVQTLAARRRYGRMLTDALASSAVPRSDVPPHVARHLLRVVGAGFT